MVRKIRLQELATLVGHEVGVSDWLTIDQEMVDQFAALTGDSQWVHVDVARAERETGGTIVHGLLILSLIVRLTGQIMAFTDFRRGLNYGYNKIRFTSPVPTGSQIRLRESILNVEKRGEGYLVTRECRIEILGSERPALIAEWLLLLFPESAR